MPGDGVVGKVRAERPIMLERKAKVWCWFMMYSTQEQPPCNHATMQPGRFLSEGWGRKLSRGLLNGKP